eukprot:77328_1
MMLPTLLIIISYIHHIDAIFRTCTGTDCGGESLSCTDGDNDCKLICNANACASFNGGLEQYTCSGSNLCEIECIGAIACQDLIVVSTSNTKLTCSGGDSACKDLDLTVTADTTPVQVNITCNATEACGWSKFRFEGTAIGSTATINCDLGCIQADISCSWNNYQCDVYCPWSFVGPACAASSLCCGGQSHGQTCNIWQYNVKKTQVLPVSPTNNVFYYDNACTLDPTNAPSISPSITPTQPPSVSPSISPSLSPTISPTQPPSISPTISPTLAPSLNPSVSPTQPPSISPSFSPTNAPSI